MPDARSAIGVDVGGTKTAAGTVNVATGRVSNRTVFPTAPERGGAAVLADVVQAISDQLAEGATGTRRGRVGVAIAELVSPSGVVTSKQTIDWKGMDVSGACSAVGDVVVFSDVRAGALAEARLGAGKGLDSFVYVSVGTGISSSLVIDGLPFAGANGNALVAASGSFSCRCPHCGADVEIVPENIASGAALAQLFADATSRHDVRGAADVLVAAQEGDRDAKRIVRDGGRMLGVVVGHLVNVLDPNAIVIGGGLGLAPGAYHDAFVASFREHIWADNSRDIPVLPAVLGTDAVLIGAAIAATDLPAEA